ncbi:hypothetical protein Dsin_003565 [Dipteronia sinensis]|uniref:C-JID domain-containing protein n=1 Tax=Dipteronia sinensis TaxID=43782 RepID=A0AAE0EKS2_9ROSI|nr:hypothetical protein Dsin_003565 [Dipteronia sinensis]
MMIVMLQQLGNRLSNRCYICNPGNEIPEWFSCRSDDNSVKIGLPPNWLNDEFMGIAMCVVVTPDFHIVHPDEGDVKCRMDIIGNSYIFKLPSSGFTNSDYLWLAYLSREQFEHDRSLTLEAASLHSYDSTNFVSVSTSTCIHARFEYDGSKEIKSTGIRLVYKRDMECYEDGIVPATDDGSILHQHHNCSTLPATENASNKSRHIDMSSKLEVSYFRPYSDDEKEFLLNHLSTLEGEKGFFYRGVGREGKMF